MAAYAAVPSLLGTLSSLFINASSDTSTLSRTAAFNLSAPFIRHNPWLGVGFNTFFPQTTFFTDDQYLNTLISTGVIGLVTLVALFVTGWLTVRSARRRIVDPERETSRRPSRPGLPPARSRSSRLTCSRSR